MIANAVEFQGIIHKGVGALNLNPVNQNLAGSGADSSGSEAGGDIITITGIDPMGRESSRRS
ncbi:MAG UNVERIFIED_CONTAM: hypothetical protein LVQ98_06915 [Rickettsiaceae bacterium]